MEIWRGSNKLSVTVGSLTLALGAAVMLPRLHSRPNERGEKTPALAEKRFLWLLEKGRYYEAQELACPGLVHGLLTLNDKNHYWKDGKMYGLAKKWKMNPNGSMKPIIRRWAHQQRLAVGPFTIPSQNFRELS